MAFHSKKEFAKLCGLETNVLAIYIKRQKVVCSGEFIDDEYPANKHFYENRLLQIKQKKLATTTNVEVETIEQKIFEKPAQVEVKPKRLQKPDIAIAEPRKLRKSELNLDAGVSLFELEKQKKALDIQKTTEEVEILKVKKEKLHGIVIPTETVKILVTQLSKSILNEFKNGTENILTKITAQANLNRNQVAELRLEFIEIINAAVNAAVDDSQKSLKNIVTDFAIKKEVGERN